MKLKANEICIGDIFVDTKTFTGGLWTAPKFVVIGKEKWRDGSTIMVAEMSPQAIVSRFKEFTEDYDELFTEKNRVYDAENARWYVGGEL